MALITLAVSGYRSLRSLVLPLEQLNVVTGANGSGKSSLYRSLRLLADVAQGQAIASLAAEGGLRSTMCATEQDFQFVAGLCVEDGLGQRSVLVQQPPLRRTPIFDDRELIGLLTEI